MTIKDYILILSVGHIIADFYMQSVEMAEKKEQKMKWLLLHALYYWVGMFLVTLPFLSHNMLIIASTATILHFIIDLAKYLIKKHQKKKNVIKKDRNLFVLDQLLHFCCLIAISYIMVIKNIVIEENLYVKSFFITMNLSEREIFSWLLAILMIYKPADILIQKILKAYKPASEMRQSNIIIKDNNTGRIIGMAERTIMLIFLAIGQYSSVGLVLTAKSIARYDRISKEQDFAEYYLLGTLLSTIIVVLCSFIII